MANAGGIAVGGAGTQRPIQDGLFTWPSEQPQLIASRCTACGELTFPRQDSCPACTSRQVEEQLLSTRGTLWTFTVQHFPPPAPPYVGPTDPASFVPLGVGYVELPEGIRVEGHLTENDVSKLAIGMPMQLVIEPFAIDPDGSTLMKFAFEPASDGSGDSQ
jgi:uncharacterized OB-fold protein